MKDIYQLVNESADRKMLNTRKPIKRNYQRLTCIATYAVLGLLIVELIAFAYGLYLVTKI